MTLYFQEPEDTTVQFRYLHKMWGEVMEEFLIIDSLRRERKSQEALSLVDAINKKYDVNYASSDGPTHFTKWIVYMLNKLNKCF